MTCGTEPIRNVASTSRPSSRLTRFSLAVVSPPADGYAFSQEEHGVVSQSQVVRSYDTRQQRPSL